MRSSAGGPGRRAGSSPWCSPIRPGARPTRSCSPPPRPAGGAGGARSTRLLDGQPWVDIAPRRRGPAAPGPRRARAGRRFGRACAMPSPRRPRTSPPWTASASCLLATALERVARPGQRGGDLRPGGRAAARIAGWLRIRAAAVTDDSAEHVPALRWGHRSARARPDRLERGGRPSRHRRPHGRRRALPRPRRAGHGAPPPARREPRQRPPGRRAAGAGRARGRPPEPGRGARRHGAARQRVCAAHPGRGAGGRPGRRHGGQLPPRRRRVRARLRGSARHARRPLRVRHRR